MSIFTARTGEEASRVVSAVAEGEGVAVIEVVGGTPDVSEVGGTAVVGVFGAVHAVARTRVSVVTTSFLRDGMLVTLTMT